MKKYYYPLILLFFVFVFFWQFLLRGMIALPADSLDSLYHPLRDYFAKDFPRGYPFKNFLITDPVLQQYPWRILATTMEKEKSFPYWNPYQGSGEPLLANIQSASLYPLNVLFFIAPQLDAWMILVILQLVLGGLFMYLYLLNLKLKKEAALFSSSVFIFSGVFFSWLTWNTLLQVLLWLPLVLLLIDKIIIAVTNKSRFRWSLLLTTVLSFAFLAGHTQIFLYIFLLSIFYFVAKTVKTNKYLLNYGFFIFSILLFLFITLIQSFPLLQYINLSSRAVDQSNWQGIAGWFIPWQHLIQFLAPDFFGNPTTLNYFGVWNYAELNGYVGIITLLFAVFALLSKKSREIVFFSLTLIVSLVFAFPTFLAKLPFEFHLPIISSVQPTRLLSIVDFSLAVLAAYGVENFLNKKGMKKLFFVGLGFCFLVLLVWIYIILNKNTNISLHISQKNFYLPTAILIFSLVLFYITYKFDKRKILLFVFVILLVINVFDLMRYGFKFTPFVSRNLIYPKTKVIAFLQKESEVYPWRFMGVDYVSDQKRVMPPNIGSYYKIYSIDSYNSLLLQNYQDFIAEAEWGYEDVSKVSFNRIIIPNNYSSSLIDFLGVKYFVTINDYTSPKLKYLFSEGESRVYENLNVLPRAFIVYRVLQARNSNEEIALLHNKNTNLGNSVILNSKINMTGVKEGKSSVKFINYEENKVVLDVYTQNPGILVLSDNYYPGWNVTIDDKEAILLRANHSFRAVLIPGGNHRVTMIYKLL